MSVRASERVCASAFQFPLTGRADLKGKRLLLDMTDIFLLCICFGMTMTTLCRCVTVSR